MYIRKQVQVRVSFSEDTYSLLKNKAQEVGVPISQYIKHLVVSSIEDRRREVRFGLDEQTILEDKDDLEKLTDSVRRVRQKLAAYEWMKKNKRY
jgi:hypothetical protein